MRAMAEAARDHGMSLVCFTDHFDMDDDVTGRHAPCWPERWPAMVAEMGALMADPPRGIDIRWERPTTTLSPPPGPPPRRSWISSWGPSTI